MAQGRDTVRQGVQVADWGRWSATARGRCPPAWQTALRRDPLLRGARVVVDLVLGQRRILLATVPITSTSLDGGLRPYQQELQSEPELVSAIEPGTPDPGARSVTVSLRGEVAQIPRLLSSGWPIAGQGEVSLLADGMRWEDRIVWIRGPLSASVAFGCDDEPVTVTVSDPQITSAMIPPYTITASRFPSAPDQSLGEPIPIVITSAVATPCPRTRLASGVGTTNRFLAGQGRLTVGNVWVNGVLTSPSGSPQTLDQRGLPVTFIEFPNGTTDEQSSVHATVSHPQVQDRPLIVAIRAILESVGGVVAERVSDRLFAESEARMADVGASPTSRTSPRIVLNSQGRVLQVVSSLLADWPMISMAWEGAGIGPVVIDHRAEPVARLTLDQYPILKRSRGSRYETTASSELRTGFQVRYGYSAMKDSWSGLVERNADNNDLCALALEVCQTDQYDGVMDAYSVGDQATANQIADWLCEHRARPSLAVRLEAYPEAWLLLREGDTVTWTDPEVGLSEAPAIVTSRRWARGGEGTRVEVGLRVYPTLTAQIGGGEG